MFSYHFIFYFFKIILLMFSALKTICFTVTEMTCPKYIKAAVYPQLYGPVPFEDTRLRPDEMVVRIKVPLTEWINNNGTKVCIDPITSTSYAFPLIFRLTRFEEGLTGHFFLTISTVSENLLIYTATSYFCDHTVGEDNGVYIIELCERTIHIWKCQSRDIVIIRLGKTKAAWFNGEGTRFGHTAPNMVSHKAV